MKRLLQSQANVRFLPLVLLLCLINTSFVFAKAPVWKVERIADENHSGSVLYLGGTMHVLAEEDFPLPTAFDIAFKQASTVVFELDLDAVNSPYAAGKMMQLMISMDGKKLSDKVTQRTWRRFSHYLKAMDVSSDHFEQLTPAGVSLTLLSIEFQRRGMDLEGVDQYFWNLAEQAGKRRMELETLDVQLGLLAALNKVDPNELLDASVDDSHDFERMLANLKKGWRTGNNALLVSGSGMDQMQRDWPELFHKMFTRRNANWLPKIEALLTTPETELVLVGAGHMIGTDGLVSLLQNKNYIVTQME